MMSWAVGVVGGAVALGFTLVGGAGYEHLADAQRWVKRSLLRFPFSLGAAIATLMVFAELLGTQ